MDKWKVVLICFLLMIIDNTVMPFISLYGAFPSLLFVFALGYSIINGRKDAVFIGVLSGVLQDIFFYRGIGVNSLGNMFLCLLAAIIGESILKNKKIIPIIITFLLSMIKVMFVAFIFKLGGDKIDIDIAVLSSIYNTFVMFCGYKFVLKLCDKKDSRDSWRFK